jgi:DNA repair ATPase RecN
MAKTTLTCERDEAVKERDEAQSCLRICQANYAKRKDECENVLRQCQKARQERDEARARIAELERELLNASELIEANEKLMNEEAKLRSEVERLYAANGLLLKGRDADRARIAELESAKWNVEAIVFHKNGTWEWRKG